MICHWEAWWVSSASGSEKAEDSRVGVRLIGVAPLTGEILTGWLGGNVGIVVKEVSADQSDQLP